MNGLLFRLFSKPRQLVTAEEGQDLIEYAMLFALISLAVIAGVGTVGSSISTMLSNLAKSI
jgi:Flp pilus assembly pilin Flp